jgi:hypothetical protein
MWPFSLVRALTAFLPAADGSAACPGLWFGGLGAGCLAASGGADRVWAGQAAVAVGPQAASKRLRHSRSRCHASGRWRVRWRARAALALNLPDGRVRQGPVVEVGQQLFDDRVAAVLLLGLEGLVRFCPCLTRFLRIWR